jgi:hypothetical protein
MKANHKFQNLPLEFWSNVKLISQKVGYTKKGILIVPTLTQIKDVYAHRGLDVSKVISADDTFTEYGQLLIDYFTHRKDVLTKDVEPNLMKAAEAKELFDRLKKQLKPKCPLPLNKQKGNKKDYAFLTGIVNMLMEANIGGLDCNYNPLELTSVTLDNFPVRTLSRRVDGAFPSTINPIVIWEVKEYYYTTTFGSRVADGVYETLLDGFELREVRENIGIYIDHYLFLDDHYTWWECGKSYLCRIIDMLHIGILTEVLFGKEVIAKLPQIAQDLATKYKQQIK